MVRANAAALLIDAFPLQNPDSSNEEVDNLLQKQFDILQVQ
jgi:condensin-2 complex subunit G2